jgi:hypothetical protein
MAGDHGAPDVAFYAFGEKGLPELLRLTPPHFSSRDEAFRQLSYVERYAAELGCKSLALESHYIDRDYIEDHSVFYARSLFPYANFCRRVHFFKCSVAVAQQGINRAVQTGIESGRAAYGKACGDFSDEAYLGFCVVKPLEGSPVGRTVLRTFSEDPQKGYRRCFPCTRWYTAHLLGVEFRVRGLAFQQQDVGVSACATTAIWSALQKAPDHEAVAAVTPAQVTTLAARYSLPFGRAMPSEGLSLDQMCQAVQAIGLSPNLVRVENDFDMARGYLFSAIESGISPVLILRQGRAFHAVAIAGMKVAIKHTTTGDPDDLAADLIGVYLHDDRLGPYLSANLAMKDTAGTRRAEFVIERRSSAGGEESLKENWELTHLLVPMHAKVRLSFNGLRQAAVEAAGVARAYASFVNEQAPGTIENPTVQFATSICRAHHYVESAFLGSTRMRPDHVAQLTAKLRLSRYIGVVRLSSSFFDAVDLLVDTPGTRRNTQCLGIVAVGVDRAHTRWVASFLAKRYAPCAIVGI